MKYSERRTQPVRIRILSTQQRLTKKYPPEAGANGSAPAADIRTTPNGNGVPSPNGGVAAEQSLRVVRAFACDDGAPIHLQYDGQAFHEPGGTSLGGQSHSASSTLQALPHHFEAFGDAADPACASSPQAGVQPTMPAENKALQGQNGGMVPASNQVPSRDTTPSSSGNLVSVPVNTTPPAQTPNSQPISSLNTPAENAPQSAAPNLNAPARVAPQSLPPDNEDTFAADLQALLSEARRRVNTGQEMPALSPAPAGQAVVPPAATPPAPPQPPAPTAASPAAQAQTAGTDTADRHALFDQLGQQMQRAVTFDMGTVPVDKTFAAIEAAIDAQDAHTARRAQGKRKPVQAKPLSPIEVVEDLALSTAPRQPPIRDSYTYESPSNIVTQQSNYSVAQNPGAVITVAEAAEVGLSAISVIQNQASASQGSFTLFFDKVQRLLTTEARARMPGSQSSKKTYSYRLLYFGIGDKPPVEFAKADVIIEWEGNAYGEIGTPIIKRNLRTSTEWSRSSANTTIVKVDRIPLPQTDPRTWPIVYVYEGTYDPVGNGHFEFSGEFEINAFGGLKFNKHEVVSRSLADWAFGGSPQDYVQKGRDVIVPVPAIPQEQLEYLRTRLP
jgi:hypothetical protein